MKIRFVARLACVVTAASAVGISSGMLISRAFGRHQEIQVHPLRITSRVGQVLGKPAPEKERAHVWLNPTKTNIGARGVLNVRGSVRVAKPNEFDPAHDNPFDVVVRVEDKFGNVVVDYDHIGSGIDKTGESNWEQVFSASYRVPAGEYVVEMLAHNPNKKLHLPDGTIVGPFDLGFARWKMTVR